MLTEKSAFAGERIAKVLARASVCSRRDAEKLIAEGRVSVDGRRLDTPAFNVTPQQKISVDGKLVRCPDTAPVAAQNNRTCHHNTRPRGRLFQGHTITRGVTRSRLDINTEGLLLMTNDGGLKRFLELPSTGWLRPSGAGIWHGRPERLADLKNRT